MACPGLVVHVARLLHVLVHDDSLNMHVAQKSKTERHPGFAGDSSSHYWLGASGFHCRDRTGSDACARAMNVPCRVGLVYVHIPYLGESQPGGGLLITLSMSVSELSAYTQTSPRTEKFCFFRPELAASENAASNSMRSSPKLRIC